MQVNVRKPAKQIITLAALLVCALLPIPRSFAATVYWNLFNIEGESSLSAVFDTYATLADMLTDQNRTGSFTANGHAPFGANIVGAGSDGATYWNLFNVEGESSLSAVFDTYATLTDMLTDQNRTGSFTANGHAPFGANIVGTGAMIVPDIQGSVPTPVPLALLIAGVGLVLLTRAAAPHGATDEPRVQAHA